MSCCTSSHSKVEARQCTFSSKWEHVGSCNRDGSGMEWLEAGAGAVAHINSREWLLYPIQVKPVWQSAANEGAQEASYLHSCIEKQQNTALPINKGRYADGTAKTLYHQSSCSAPQSSK